MLTIFCNAKFKNGTGKGHEIQFQKRKGKGHGYRLQIGIIGASLSGSECGADVGNGVGNEERVGVARSGSLVLGL